MKNRSIYNTQKFIPISTTPKLRFPHQRQPRCRHLRLGGTHFHLVDCRHRLLGCLLDCRLGCRADCLRGFRDLDLQPASCQDRWAVLAHLYRELGVCRDAPWQGFEY